MQAVASAAASSSSSTSTTPTSSSSSTIATTPATAISSLPLPPPSVASVLSDYTSRIRRRVLQGTCGWNDESIGKCGRFYPGNVKNAVDRLRHYATHFPCVEVDTSNYAIPPPDRIREWMHQTPPTFKFHFKIFSMFTALNVDYKAIPGAIRHLIEERHIKNGKVRLQDTSDAFKQALWSLWNQMLRPVHEAGKLGLVVFQFHLSFQPTEESKAHIRWCRECLDSNYQMGIEFRARSWFASNNKEFTDEDFIAKTVKFARSINCALIAEDDLAHEVTGRFIPLKPGEKPVHLPIILRVAAPHALYIRLHRRQGNQRVLADEEFVQWAERFYTARGTSDVELEGPIYFLIGTDHEDQPIINSKKMMHALLEFDENRQKQYEARTSTPIAAASSAVVASSSSSSAAASSLSSIPPEPLAFDYPRYYKQVLSRLPNATLASSSSQLSLGSFFGSSSSSSHSAPKNSVATSAAPIAASHIPSTFATPIVAPPITAVVSSPSRRPPIPAAAAATSSSFVLASALPIDPAVLPESAVKSTFISSMTAAAAASSSSSSSVAAGSSSASSSSAAASSSMDLDISAEVAAIERAYRQDERKESPSSSSSVTASPAKRKAPSSATKASPAKKSKTAANKTPGISSFFKKVEPVKE